MSIEALESEVERYRAFDAMTPEARRAEAERLKETDPLFLSRMVAWSRRCDIPVDELTDERCGALKYGTFPTCLDHVAQAPIKDTSQSIAARRLRAQVRATEMTEKALGVFEEILDDTMQQPSIRAKVAAEVLDRGGVPRHTHQTAEMRVEGEVTVTSAADIVKQRLDQLAAAYTERELKSIESHLDEDGSAA